MAALASEAYRVRIPTPPPAGHETPNQVADRLGVPVSTVYSWMRRGLLKVRKDWNGNRKAISTAEVDKLVRSAQGGAA